MTQALDILLIIENWSEKILWITVQIFSNHLRNDVFRQYAILHR
jgi:hypothetical protein